MKLSIATAAMMLMWGACAAAAAMPGAAQGRKSMVIAHRGASGYAPENTMASFKLGYEMGADMIELDIYKSADGHLVVMHDDKVERTTDGTGLIEDMTLEQIKKLDAGSKISAKFAGEQVPTLDEVFAWAADRIPINVEIKGVDCEEKLVELIKKYDMHGKVLVSSFHHDYLKKVKALDPEVPIAALVGDPENIEAIIKDCAPDALNPRFNNVNKAVIDKAHSLGLKVNIYTVNDPLTMRQMAGYGADGIFTNYPDKLVKLVEPKKKKESARRMKTKGA